MRRQGRSLLLHFALEGGTNRRVRDIDVATGLGKNQMNICATEREMRSVPEKERFNDECVFFFPVVNR